MKISLPIQQSMDKPHQVEEIYQRISLKEWSGLCHENGLRFYAGQQG